MRGLNSRFAVVAAAIGLAGLLSAEAQSQPQDVPERRGTRDCFDADNISGFTAPDEKTVYVRATRSRVYELQVLGSCPNLDWTHTIGLRTRGGSARVCTGMDVDLVVPQDSRMGRLSCAVRTMRRLSPEEIEALPKGERP